MSIVAQSRRIAPITGNHFHKLREGIIRLENENRSFLIEPLPISKWVVPDVRFVDILEKTSVSKLDKKVLRQKHGSTL